MLTRSFQIGNKMLADFHRPCSWSRHPLRQPAYGVLRGNHIRSEVKERPHSRPKGGCILGFKTFTIFRKV